MLLSFIKTTLKHWRSRSKFILQRGSEGLQLIAKRLITCGFLDAPMTMAECMIILSKLHTIGGMSL